MIYLKGIDCVPENGVPQAKFCEQFVGGPRFLAALEELFDRVDVDGQD